MGTDKKSVFRKKSVEELSSPDQLDQLMQVTTSKGWIALITFCAFLGAALLWGVVGSVPTRVQGTGVIIKTGGIYDVMPLASGQVTDVRVRPGDRVEKGQVIARVEQPELRDKLKQVREELEVLRSRHRRLKQFQEKDTELQVDLVKQERESYRASISDAQERIDWLTEKVDSQQNLLEEGLITKKTLLNTKNQLQSAQQRIARLRSKLKQTTLKKLTSVNQRQQEVSRSRSKIDKLELQVKQLKEQLQTDSEVTSPHAGRIIEVLVEPGGLAQRGRAIARLDRPGGGPQDLQAVVYIPGTDGKKVKSDMEVHVSPTTVKKEEFGSIKAEVSRVSEFPATPARMQRVLNNDQLVKMLAAKNAPYEMYASLKVDPSTFSGYKWSSSSGPQTHIRSGTMCQATVTVKERRPIELVMPALKKLFGV
jgi:HlyD family secretion protein